MRTSRLSTSAAACSIWEALVTSSVSGVTRLSECCIGPRVPAYTFLAPRLSASSTSARPMPRFAPVIRTVLFSISILASYPTFNPYYGCRAGGDTWEIGRESGGLVGDEGSGCGQHPGTVPVVRDIGDSAVHDVEPESVVGCPTG